MNDLDDRRFRAQADMEDHLRACEDCTLARHGQGRQCRQGLMIERRMRSLGGLVAPVAGTVVRPAAAAPVFGGVIKHPSEPGTKLDLPLTRQGVRDLDLLGSKNRQNGRRS